MECLAGVGAVTAKASYSYNWENFQYDRWLRMKKEFQLFNFRNEQAQLWREDVRDLCSLTEYKMHAYLLVNVFMLGVTIVLWCMGRLPESTPDWMMMGISLSITGAFIFLLLSIWLAMHAAVSAQAYQTRLLTQLVRMPIPTWDELEACRTCASDFEKCEAKQMFRIPFLMGRQEDLVSSAAPVPTRGGEGGGGGAATAPLLACGDAHPVDPWGLESSGDKICELGIVQGADVAKLRHVKLARQAMVYWQTYDAFARVSMSVGVIELLLALSFYVLGYVLVQDDCRTAAAYGVILLTIMAQSVMHMDMTLAWWEALVIQISGCLTPVLSCLAAFHWSSHGKIAEPLVPELLITTAFISHAFFLAVMTWLCRVTMHDNGSILPFAYRSVLYLDVFGWVRGDAGPELSPSAPSRAFLRVSSRIVRTMASFASSDSIASANSDVEDIRPATAAVQFDDNGVPVATRPEDFILPHAKEDLRHEDGAPTGTHRKDVRPGFFSQASWMQGEASRPAQRCSCGTLFMDDSLFCRRCGCKRQEEVPACDDDFEDQFIATGHEAHSPGVLPWQVFSGIMVLLCLAWLGGGVYHGLCLSQTIEHEPIVWDSDPSSRYPDEPWEREVKPPKKIMTLVDIGVATVNKRSAAHEHARVEVVPTAFPHVNFRPQTLTCDADGRRFAVTDRFRTLFAEREGEPLQHDLSSRRQTHVKRGRGHLRAAWKAFTSWRRHGKDPLTLLNFTSLSCDALFGEGLQDAALSCGVDDATSGCHAVILHRHGRRVSACPLKASRHEGVTVAALSSSWLDTIRGGGSGVGAEKAVALTIDTACWSGLGVLPSHCAGAFAATSNGRVVQLRKHSQRHELIPEHALQEVVHGAGAKDGLHPGAVRVLGGGYLGILKENGRFLDVMDPQRNVHMGRISLPAGRRAASFCSGGGHLYFLGEGPRPKLFRVPLPSVLEPEEIAPDP